LIYRTGKEYRDVFPVSWNWNKIPRTTAEQIVNFTIQMNPQAKTGADFVSGVSDGSVYGACVPQMMAGPQSRQWSDIGTGLDEPLTSDVMTLWLNHGMKPKNTSSACFVLLDGAEEASNIKVLANMPDLQAALNTKLNLLAAAFWKVGTLNAGDLKIKVDQPCMVLACNQQITVFNPCNQPLVVNLKVNGIALTFNLPAGVMAGSSITQELPLMFSDFLVCF
jgi:Polysaccharide lyase family 8, C-terminal beta-sandwich domain/Polysaccharide lyase family 8, super-sandwich domain